jgi:predicted transcriptional regulator
MLRPRCRPRLCVSALAGGGGFECLDRAHRAIMGPYCMFLQYSRFWYDLVIPFTGVAMGAAVKKTISLPAELAREAEAVAKAEGKTLSAVIQDALRQARVGRRDQELRGIQGYWSRTAREHGILTEQDLERYLRA